MELSALLLPMDEEHACTAATAIADPLASWYRLHARKLPWRENRDPYRIWISEIMLQQTRVEAVIPYYHRFLNALPNVAALAEASEEQLHKLWEGLGYYSRVRNLQKAARQVMERYDGKLPPSYELLTDLCGIGAYTGGAIASIAFDVPVPAVDGNVLRVFSRLLMSEGDISSAKVRAQWRELLLHTMPQENPGIFNQAVMEVGATVCLPNGQPQCVRCPLAFHCLASQNGVPQLYPVKAPKAARRVEERTVLLLTDGARVLLRRRPENGLLAGLWEFPGESGWLDRDAARLLLEKRGLLPDRLLTMKECKHIFTHIEWRMRGYLAVCKTLSGDILQPDEVLADREELESRYAIPNAFSKFKKQWMDGIH